MTAALVLLIIDPSKQQEQQCSLRENARFSENWKNAITKNELMGYTAGWTVKDDVEPFRKMADNNPTDGWVDENEANALVQRYGAGESCANAIERNEQKVLLLDAKKYQELQKQNVLANYTQATVSYCEEVRAEARTYNQDEMDAYATTRDEALAQIEKDLAEINEALKSL